FDENGLRLWGRNGRVKMNKYLRRAVGFNRKRIEQNKYRTRQRKSDLEISFGLLRVGRKLFILFCFILLFVKKLTYKHKYILLYIYIYIENKYINIYKIGVNKNINIKQTNKK